MSALSVRVDRKAGLVWWPQEVGSARRLAIADVVESLRAGHCPFCNAGPFVVVASHTNRAHGIDRLRLRDMIGVTYSTPICDPTHSRAMAAISAREVKKNPRRFDTVNRPRRKMMSEAAKATAAERLRRMSSPEQRQRANQIWARESVKIRTCSHPECCNLILGQKRRTCSDRCKAENIRRKGFATVAQSQESRARAAKNAGISLRKPHPCPVCGSTIEMTRQRYCSDACHAVAKRTQSERLSERNRRRAASMPAIVPTCHPDRPHGGHGLCKDCYKRQWRAERRDAGLPYL